MRRRRRGSGRVARPDSSARYPHVAVGVPARDRRLLLAALPSPPRPAGDPGSPLLLSGRGKPNSRCLTSYSMSNNGGLDGGAGIDVAGWDTASKGSSAGGAASGDGVVDAGGGGFDRLVFPDADREPTGFREAGVRLDVA